MSKRSHKSASSSSRAATSGNTNGGGGGDDSSGEWEDPALFELLEHSGGGAARDERRLSEYELLREENIKKNLEVLSQLGIAQAKPRAVAAPAPSKAPKGKRPKAAPAPVEATRRSSRLAKAEVEHVQLDDGVGGNAPQAPPKPVRVVRTQVNVHVPEDVEEGAKKQGRINIGDFVHYLEQIFPDDFRELSMDTIRHTVDRVNSMSPHALLNRIKSIARGSGRHSMEKMLAFYHALEFIQLDALAAVAKDTYEAMRAAVVAEEAELAA